MYPDNTLTPKEAIRLCALGTLALGPSHYSALAGAVRHFVGRVLGPSLDLMGTSIELLKYEGLVEAMGGDGMADDAELIITDAGRDELHVLLTANLRTSASELNDLLTALKFRFLHLLNRDDQQAQADMLVDICDGELARRRRRVPGPLARPRHRPPGRASDLAQGFPRRPRRLTRRATRPYLKI